MHRMSNRAAETSNILYDTDVDTVSILNHEKLLI